MQLDPATIQTDQPRTVGTLRLELADHGRIAQLYQQGASKVLFARKPPRTPQDIEAIFINTSGGLTGGDRLFTDITCTDAATLTLTTQAFERIYRSRDATPAVVRNRLTVTDQARCFWLPQETLFYDGGHLDRRLDVTLGETARAVILEPIVFGRHAMGETQISGHFHDRISITCGNTPLFLDNTVMTGDITKTLDRPAVGAGARAGAMLLYHAPDAPQMPHRLAPHLNAISGASAPHDTLCVARLLAKDGLELRRMLLPILDDLTAHTLPKTWRL